MTRKKAALEGVAIVFDEQNQSKNDIICESYVYGTVHHLYS